jgi:hypothetical protein
MTLGLSGVLTTPLFICLLNGIETSPKKKKERNGERKKKEKEVPKEKYFHDSKQNQFT